LGFVLCLLVLLGMCRLYSWFVVEEWVFAAYMLLGVVSAVLMKLAAVSGVHVRLVAECQVHTGNMCLDALPFAD
jgi:hypothetical protein